MGEVEDRTKSEIPGSAVSKGTLMSRDVEVMPQYEVEQRDIDYKRMLSQFREQAAFVSGVRKEALAQTKAHHWLARKQKNGTVTYSLMSPGAERIKSVTPIGFQNKRYWEETWNKESGPGYTCYFEADYYLGSPRMGLLPAIGSCSSSDEFFATEHVELPYNVELGEHKLALESGEGKLSNDGKTLYIRRQIPASEVSKDLIMKSALTQLQVNGLTRVLGIRSISEEELKEAGIDIAKIGGFEYGSTRAASGQLAPADQQKRDEIKKWLIEMNGGDEAKALAELKSRTKFNDYAGCDGWDRITVKQLARKHPEIKADYDASREGRPDPKTDKAQAEPAKGGSGAGVKPSGGKGGSAAGGQQPLL